FLRQVRSGKDGLHGIRIGLPREYYAEGIDPDIADVARKTARTLEGMGAKVEEMSLPHTEYALPTYYVMASAEASSNLSRYDGIRYGLRETGDGIEELYRNTRTSGFGDEVKRRIMLGSYALSAGYYDAFYLKAARVRRAMAEEIFEAFREYDYLLTPTTPTTAFEIGDRVEDPVAMYMADICTIPANLAGIPAVSFPGGFVDGLPVGVQLMGPRFSDGGLLAMVDAFQRASDYHLRRPPTGEGDEA
ncbi:MAG: amidase family protein, partial [Clostridia bacterium]